MSKKTFAVLFLTLSCAGIFAQAAPHPHRVVFVVTSPDQEDWQSAMVLASHYIAGIKPETAEVEVVAYGGGIDLLKKGASVAVQLSENQKLGVHFVACQNAMKMHHIPAGDLLPGVTSVPSGVVELVQKQEAGWSYVKVGK